MSVADLAEITADVGEAGAGAQQVGGQGVAGLMRHTVAEVAFVNPLAQRHRHRIKARPRTEPKAQHPAGRPVSTSAK
jgi:hypothetical protein